MGHSELWFFTKYDAISTHFIHPDTASWLHFFPRNERSRAPAISARHRADAHAQRALYPTAIAHEGHALAAAGVAPHSAGAGTLRTPAGASARARGVRRTTYLAHASDLCIRQSVS